MDARTRIRDFIQGYLKDDSLEDDENMFELGYVDSLFALQLVLFVEKEFGFTVSRDKMRLTNFRSVDALVELVENQPTEESQQ
jgi:Acyl carrier protein